jgi:hypothetical protein
VEAPRGVELTGTNKPCGLTIFFLYMLRVDEKNYRLQDIQLLARRSATREGGSLFDM